MIVFIHENFKLLLLLLTTIGTGYPYLDSLRVVKNQITMDVDNS